MSLKSRTLSVRLPLFCVFGLLLFSGASASAQSASVSGRVLDPSSALIGKAQVTFTDLARGTSQTTHSNDAGFYSLPFVQPGIYTLTVEANGFKRYERTKITVETAQSLVADVHLQIGDISQSVTVDGSGNNINTTDASVSTVIDREFVENIPLNGRSFQSLMTSVPGVSVVPSTTGQSGEFTVNGQRTEANYFTVDGVSVTTGTNSATPGLSAGYAGLLAGETTLGTTQSLVSIDDLEEFRASTSTYSAEYGRTPGGQFTFTTRSGTNDWHGSAFDYLRNDALDANNWFNNYLGQPRQAERQNDFGGTFGGPVKIPRLYDGRDKTFFFFSYEGLRLREPQGAQEYEVPSLDLRQKAPADLQPFLNAFPKPNGGDAGDGLSYFTSGYVSPSSLDSSSIRIDHSFSDRFKIFGRYNDAPSNIVSRSAVYTGSLSNPNSLHNDIKSLTLGSTNVSTTRISNDARFNLTQNNSGQSFSVDTFGGATPVSLSDMPGLTPSDWMILYLGYGNFPYYGLTPLSNRQRQWNVNDTINVILGRHSFKFGVDYRRLTTESSLPNHYELAEFTAEDQILANQTAYFIDYHTQGEMDPVYQNFSAFAQDDWKLNSRLSLAVGLRWELNPAPHDGNGNDPYTITTTDLATTVVAPKGTPLWQTTYDNFAPRVGIAYQVHQQPGHETVLRAGAGLFYDSGNTVGSGGYTSGVGLTSSTAFSGSAFPLTEPQLASVPAPSAAPPYNSEVVAFDPHLKLPHTWEWNVALEQALGQQQSLTLNYVASAGRRLLLQKRYDPSLSGNLNFVSYADGGLGLYLTTNGATSDYNSLQVQFQRRLSHGLQTLFSYTWAHAFDDATSNYTVHALERAASDYDIRNNFQAELTYSLPSNYSGRVAAALLKTWAFDARISARSSLPVDIIGASNFDSMGALENFHPNRLPNEPLYVEDRSVPGGRRINLQAFQRATAPDGTDIEGDFLRNGTRGFDAVQADIAMRRDFSITSTAGLQFRVEAFNLLNHPIFGNIRNSLSNGASFGQAYETQNASLGGLSPLYQVGGPRSLQVALRLHF